MPEPIPASIPPDAPLIGRILRLAIPALAQQYTFFLIQQYDQFLARNFSEEHQAALTTANYLYWFISSYSVVVSAGATALVGRSIGAKDSVLANRATGQALVLAVLFGSLATLLAYAGLDALMAGIRLRDNSPRIAVEYLTPLAAILVLQMMETAGIACLVGAGDTKTGLAVLVGVALVNVPVAWLLSGGGGPALDFGFTGIALGTAAAHSLGGLTILALLLRGRSGLKLNPALLVPDPAILRRLLRVSIPAAVDSLSIACCQLWFLSIVNGLGTVSAAAHGIALRWEALGYLAGAAFGAAASATVSQSLGQKRPDLATRYGWGAYGLGGALMSAMGVFFYLLAGPMCELYSPGKPQVTALAVSALRTIAFAMPAVAAWIIFTAALRAAGDTRVLALFSWTGFLGVRIPLALWLSRESVDLGTLGTVPGMGWGLLGAWVAMVADLYFRGALFVMRWASGRWKSAKV